MISLLVLLIFIVVLFAFWILKSPFESNAIKIEIQNGSTGEIVESKLVEDAEKALYAEIQNILPVVQPLLAAKDYTAALSKLAALRAPIDAFFDGVMVMADDSDLKANRLRLLAQLRDLFTSVADISVLQH